MPAEDVRRERRTVLALGLVIAAVAVVGVVAAMVFTGGEPRRGEGMIPPPMEEPERVPDAPAEGDNGPGAE